MNNTIIDKIKTSFIKKFNKQPLLIFSPGRINLIGGHTDYNEGFVFPAAINKGIVTAISKSERNVSSIIALDADEQLDVSLNKLNPTQNGRWKNYVIGVIAEIQKKGKIIGNFNLIFAGDIPAGSGLSSSAALENSIVFALNEQFNLELSKKEMILISQRAEHNFVHVKCGIMDQYAGMFGQKNSALLLDCRSLEATTYLLDFKDYELVLINTNVTHSLAESSYNERRAVCEEIANLLNVTALREASEKDLMSLKNKITADNYQKALYIIQENQRVLEAIESIKKNKLKLFGEFLFASHYGLQKQYKVSCKELDFLVDIAKEDKSVLGARMMGGGFGGCTINLIKKEGADSFKSFISEVYKGEFNITCSIYSVLLSEGTHLIK